MRTLACCIDDLDKAHFVVDEELFAVSVFDSRVISLAVCVSEWQGSGCQHGEPLSECELAVWLGRVGRRTDETIHRKLATGELKWNGDGGVR